MKSKYFYPNPRLISKLSRNSVYRQIDIEDMIEKVNKILSSDGGLKEREGHPDQSKSKSNSGWVRAELEVISWFIIYNKINIDDYSKPDKFINEVVLPWQEARINYKMKQASLKNNKSRTKKKNRPRKKRNNKSRKKRNNKSRKKRNNKSRKK
jgi:hypothetical protein